MLFISVPHCRILPCEFLCVDLSLEEGLMQCKGGAQVEIQDGHLYQSNDTEKCIWGNSLSYAHSDSWAIIVLLKKSS